MANAFVWNPTVQPCVILVFLFSSWPNSGCVPCLALSWLSRSGVRQGLSCVRPSLVSVDFELPGVPCSYALYLEGETCISL